MSDKEDKQNVATSRAKKKAKAVELHLGLGVSEEGSLMLNLYAIFDDKTIRRWNEKSRTWRHSGILRKWWQEGTPTEAEE